jgi:hypothetical protein
MVGTETTGLRKGAGAAFMIEMEYGQIKGILVGLGSQSENTCHYLQQDGVQSV